MRANQNENSIDLVAAEWVARLDARSLGAPEQAELDCWIAEDSRHHGAYVRARAAMSMLDCMRAAQGLPEARRGAPVMTRRALWGGGIAAAAVAAGGVWFVDENRRFQTFATREGEVRRLTFAGGVELILDARSKVRVLVARGLQKVILDAGRAWFDMRQASALVLTVQAGDLRLQSSRASFSATRSAEQVDLTIAEGLVAAWNSERSVTDRFTLESGSQAVLIKANLVEKVRLSPDALARASAWKTGHLALDGESVPEASV